MPINGILNSVIMDKAQIRKEIIEKRKSLTPEETCSLLQKIIDRLNQFNFDKINVVHIYLPIRKKNEIDTFPVIQFLKLIAPHLIIVIPRSNFKTFELENVVYNSETILMENDYGIMEPVGGDVVPINNIDMVICPLLTFDTNGYRVGYGKGFYDRFLSICRPDVIKIGLSYFEAISAISNIDKFDIKLDYAISPEKYWAFVE